MAWKYLPFIRPCFTMHYPGVCIRGLYAAVRFLHACVCACCDQIGVCVLYSAGSGRQAHSVWRFSPCLRETKPLPCARVVPRGESGHTKSNSNVLIYNSARVCVKEMESNRMRTLKERHT